MRKIDYTLEIGFAGCGSEGDMTVPDDMTNAEIDEMVHDMAIEWAQSWEGDNRLGWNEDQTEEEAEQETEYFYEGVYGSWEFSEEE